MNKNNTEQEIKRRWQRLKEDIPVRAFLLQCPWIVATILIWIYAIARNIFNMLAYPFVVFIVPLVAFIIEGAKAWWQWTADCITSDVFTLGVFRDAKKFTDKLEFSRLREYYGLSTKTGEKNE